MKILKKIKLNYNLKLLNDHIINNKYAEAYKFILDIKNKNKLDLYLLLRNSQSTMANLPSAFYKKKIVCLTSYSKSISRILDKHCDIILVGDSLENVLYGMKTTHNLK